MANATSDSQRIGGIQTSDPTPLTTQQILREITSLKELIFTRLDAMDKAMFLFNENITRVPTDTDKQISHLKELHEKMFGEKFESITIQFKERDTRVEQTAKDTKVAVYAALQAAERAVGKQNESFALATSKSEAATTKQIDQLGTLFQTATKGLEDKIGDLKDRFNRGEGMGEGKDREHIARNETTKRNLAAVALACTIAGLVGGLIAHFIK